MVRTIIGGLVGGLILFVVGFIFWGSPLGELPFTSAGDAQNAAVQLSLTQNLTPTGTGAYIIPAHQTRRGRRALRARADRDRLFQHDGLLARRHVDAAARASSSRSSRGC